MGEHTPGPWRVGTAPNGNWIEAGAASSRPKSIARTFYNDVGAKTEDANARLIAAAPDLLEALIRAQGFIRNGIELGFIRMPDVSTPDPAHETPEIVAAAIALATQTPAERN